MRYHGIPRGGLRVGLDRAGYRALAGETAGDRARLWLPVPDGSGGRVSVLWNIQVAQGQRAVANGTLVKIDTLAYGHTTWHYRLETPVPLDALAVAVGSYAVTTLPRATCAAPCAPVTLWTAPADSAAAARAFRRAGEMVDFLSGFLGPFPYPGLAHVASSLAAGRAPAASVVLWDEARVHAGDIGEDEIARATAAQWLGNAVSESGPADQRPSPASAAYLAWLWDRKAGGNRPNAQALTREVDAIRRLHRLVGDPAFVPRAFSATSRRTATPIAAPGALERAMSEAAGRPLDWSFAGQLAPVMRRGGAAGAVMTAGVLLSACSGTPAAAPRPDGGGARRVRDLRGRRRAAGGDLYAVRTDGGAGHPDHVQHRRRDASGALARRRHGGVPPRSLAARTRRRARSG